MNIEIGHIERFREEDGNYVLDIWLISHAKIEEM